MTAAATPSQGRFPQSLLIHWPLLVGLLALAGPTIQSLSQQAWSRESGAHGPIILATGAWLLWRQRESMLRLKRPASGFLLWIALGASLALYIFGRAFDFISLEAAGLLGAGLAVLYALVGTAALTANWFPLLYLGFLIPPPAWFLSEFTAPLKQLVSFAATGLVAAAGLPIERQGVTISIAQYQLLVEDACSGMNSLTGLVAISLLYIYLLRGSSWRYSALLTATVVPIAVAGNILRVITLILLTYYFGDRVAQGFAHFLAGAFLFAVDLVLVFMVDMVLIRLVPTRWRPA